MDAETYLHGTTDWTSFRVCKLKRRLHRLVWVYTCQNATLLEITCHGSIIGDVRTVNVSNFFLYKSVFDQISTKIRRNSTNFRPVVVVGETSYRPNVAFDQTSFRRNGFRPNVMDPQLTRSYWLSYIIPKVVFCVFFCLFFLHSRIVLNYL